MSANQVVTLLERAVEELKRELDEIEAKLADKGKPAEPRASPERALKDQHADLASMLKEQHAGLMKILNEALAEMENLKQFSAR